MIASTKLFFVLTGSAGAAVVGAGPTLQSDTTMAALLAAGAVAVTSGVVQMLRPAPAQR